MFSVLQNEDDARAVEHAVRTEMHTIVSVISSINSAKIQEYQSKLAKKDKENETLKRKVTTAEREVTALRGSFSSSWIFWKWMSSSQVKKHLCTFTRNAKRETNLQWKRGVKQSWMENRFPLWVLSWLFLFQCLALWHALTNPYFCPNIFVLITGLVGRTPPQVFFPVQRHISSHWGINYLYVPSPEPYFTFCRRVTVFSRANQRPVPITQSSHQTSDKRGTLWHWDILH